MSGTSVLGSFMVIADATGLAQSRCNGVHRPLDNWHVRAVNRRVKVIPDPGQVRRRRGTQKSQPGAGESCLGATSVAGATRPLDQTIIDQSIDESGHAALGKQKRIGQSAHAQLSTRRLGEVEKGLIFLERQGVSGAQVLIQTAGQAGMRVQERAPRSEIHVVGAGGGGALCGHSHILPGESLRGQPSPAIRAAGGTQARLER